MTEEQIRAEFDQLHQQIMNLPCKRTIDDYDSMAELRIYQEGHRDARHAAAELVAAATSSTEERVKKLREAVAQAESAMTYTQATVSVGNRGRATGDWVEVHRGRADSSYRQLQLAIDAAHKALEESNG